MVCIIDLRIVLSTSYSVLLTPLGTLQLCLRVGGCEQTHSLNI